MDNAADPLAVFGFRLHLWRRLFPRIVKKRHRFRHLDVIAVAHKTERYLMIQSSLRLALPETHWGPLKAILTAEQNGLNATFVNRRPTRLDYVPWTNHLLLVKVQLKKGWVSKMKRMCFFNNDGPAVDFRVLKNQVQLTEVNKSRKLDCGVKRIVSLAK